MIIKIKETKTIIEIKQIKKSLVEKYGNNVLVMTKIGDFYEFFNEDAVISSKICGLKLTKRNSSKAESPQMCGIPSKDDIVKNTIKKIVDDGYILGIIEQYEKSKEELKNKSGKKEFYRKLDKVITPGTFLEEEELNNYTCIIDFENILIADCFNGDLFLSKVNNLEEIIDYIQLYKPKEIIFFNQGFYYKKILDIYNNVFFISNISDIKEIKSLNQYNDLNINNNTNINYQKEIKYILNNINDNFKDIVFLYIKYIIGLFNELPIINNIEENKEKQQLSPLSIKNLDILESEQGYSLYKIINNSYTNLGKRLLRENLTLVLSEEEIKYKHILINTILQNKSLYYSLIENLNKVYDTEHILGKINNNRMNSNDLIFLQRTIKSFIIIFGILKKDKIFHKLLNNINIHLLKKIELNIDEKMIDNETYGKERFLKPFTEELSNLYDILENKNKVLKQFEEKEIKNTGLKIKLVEVSNRFFLNIKHNEKVPDYYIKVRSLKSTDRYTTKDLLNLENKIIDAVDIISGIENKVLSQIRLNIIEEKEEILKMNNILANIDLILSSIKLITEKGFILPEINNNTLIVGMKNPIVNNFVKDYVPNDVFFDKNINTIHYLSFMNGGGKSTYLKGIGLNYVLFMIGFPVLAQFARMEIIDNIFSRVGSADDILKGESTFIRELNEVNYILNNCTDKSLVLIDEFGRGTDNHSGIMLCSGVLKFLVDKKVKSVFSTHYHELETIVKKYPTINSYIVDEDFDKNGFIKFNYKLKPGFSNTSHGYEVAKLVGFNKEVIKNIKDLKKDI